MNRTTVDVDSGPQESLFDEFGACLMDPPWLERGSGKVKRGADRHYPLMSKEKILSEVTHAPEWRMAPDSHLWMWVTNNFLQDGLWLMVELGYRYVTNAVWVKMKHGNLQIGLGQYMRGAHELLLFGVAGKAMVPDPRNRPPTVIIAKRGKHSAKPDEQYELVRKVSRRGPYLEMFARRTRPGWTSWGDQI